MDSGCSAHAAAFFSARDGLGAGPAIYADGGGGCGVHMQSSPDDAIRRG